jgi:hypothetical protein
MPPGSRPVQADASFVEDQFMVTGHAEKVARLVGGLFTDFADADVSAAPLEEVNLRFLRDLVPGEDADVDLGLHLESEDLAELVTRVYPVPQGMDLDAVLETLYQRALDPSMRAIAEPNYLISGGSGCIEGGPAGAGVPGGGRKAFRDQWAFKMEGINHAPFTEVNEPQENVRVAVFDTSPIMEPGKWTIDWMEEPLDLCVWLPEPRLNLVPALPLFAPVHPENIARGPRDPHGLDMNGRYLDHGLFVSSLIHAVAHQSDIHLIRVLNGNNLGDVPTLIKALGEYLQWDLARRGGTTLQGTVLNLSLGIVDEPDPGPEMKTMRKRVSERAVAAGILNNASTGDLCAVGLETVLALAHWAGAIIVACAGNGTKGPKAIRSEAPASYPSVIGVAGHDERQKRSGFSNTGDIAAPAGKGLPHHRPLKDDGKIKDASDWLVGAAMQLGQPQGYAYWMGTSFAAPLVAGGAARLLLEGDTPAIAHAKVMASAEPDPDNSLGKGRYKYKKNP